MPSPHSTRKKTITNQQRAVANWQAANWGNYQPQQKRGLKKRPKSASTKSSRSRALKAMMIGALAMGAPRQVGMSNRNMPQSWKMREGRGITAVTPYGSMKNLNIEILGTKSYPAHQPFVFFNKNIHGPRSPPKSAGRRAFNWMFPKKAPKLITMRNLKLQQMSSRMRTGAGRRTLETVNVFTLPSTHQILTVNPGMYAKNVRNAAARAAIQGRKIFSNTNFNNVQVFSKQAFNKMRNIQAGNAKPVKHKYLVNLA